MDERYPTAAWIGERIRALREQAGLSMRQLGKAAHLTHSHILKIERGELNIPIETLARIAQALNVSLAEVVRKERGEHDEHPVMLLRKLLYPGEVYSAWGEHMLLLATAVSSLQSLPITKPLRLASGG